MKDFIADLMARDWESAGLTILGGIGGLLAYAVQTQEKGEHFLWRKAIVQFASSAFVGFIVYSLCQALGINGLWLGPIVGVFGWLGATATIQVAKRFVFNKLGYTEDRKP